MAMGMSPEQAVAAAAVGMGLPGVVYGAFPMGMGPPGVAPMHLPPGGHLPPGVAPLVGGMPMPLPPGGLPGGMAAMPMRMPEQPGGHLLLSGSAHDERRKPPRLPSDNLYITDMPLEITEEGIWKAFSNYGPVVQVKVLTSQQPGNTKGAGLVRFETVEGAIKVKESLNGKVPQGLTEPVTIRYSKDKVREAKGAGRSAPYETVHPPNETLYITGLPEEIEQLDLQRLFEQYGTMTTCKLLKNPNPELRNRAALVRFSSLDEAVWVKENLHQGIPMGLTTPIAVTFADPLKIGVGGFGGKGLMPRGEAKSDEKAPTGIFEKDNLYIKGLPITTDECEVQQIFSQYGTVTQVRVMRYNDGKDVTALVRYATVEEGIWVQENVNGNVPQGFDTPVSVKFHEVKGPAPGAAAGGPMGAGLLAAGCIGQDSMDRPPGLEAPAFGMGKSNWKGGGDMAFSCKGKGMWKGEDMWGGKGMWKGEEGGEMSFGCKGKGMWKGDEGGDMPFGCKGKAMWKGEDMMGGKGKGGGKDFRMKEVVDGFEKSNTLPGATELQNPEAILYMTGLPPDTEEGDIYRLFNPFGAIAPKGVKVMKNLDGTCRVISFVNFMDPEAARAAIEVFNGVVMPDGSTFEVKLKDGGIKRARVELDGAGWAGKGKGKGKPAKGWKGGGASWGDDGWAAAGLAAAGWAGGW